MTEGNSAEQEEFYKRILNRYGVTDQVAEVIITSPGVASKAFLSESVWITIKFENTGLKPLQLFTKKLVTINQSHVELSRAIKAFEKESTFLTKYVPAAAQLLKRKGLDESIANIYPKCYYGDENTIVMQNIVVDKGYCVLGSEKPHNWEEATYALLTLATHHAISYAMIREEGGLEKFRQCFPYLADFEGFNTKSWTDTFDPWFESCFKTNLKILEMNEDIDGVSESVGKLKKFLSTTPSLNEVILNSFKTLDDKLKLLNHGDCWYGNHMFLKDKTTGKIIHHMAIDFQLVRYVSPAVDVGHYLFSSVATNLRQGRFRELLESYITTLNKLSNDLGHPINLDFETFMSHYRKKAYYGFIASFLVCYGPGMSIFDGIDLTKVETHEWGATTDRLADEWIRKNRDKARTMVKELLQVVKEFFDLVD